ncbi:MAG: LPS-assembly protein LptD [Chitinophagaceae bacterium]|nr:LPS-assembly protein LptD [Chitinophagaceae bacterium]
MPDTAIDLTPPDTIPPFSIVDSTGADSSLNSKVKESKDGLDGPVKYNARDTIWYDITNQRVYLLGDAQVQYKDITLTADSIIFDWKNSEVTAMGRKDSSGNLENRPTFSQGERKYDAREIHFNFKTNKGKISEILTQEDEGFVRSGVVKRLPNEVLFGKNNVYTTCNLDHPHFYIASSKIEVIPGKSIVSGPANLVVADVPTPLFLPFGIFPLNAKRKSGIIFPEYGEDQNRGFFLRNGGYYFGISDNVDLALTADIYSLGSWKAVAASRFNKRYKFNGDVRMTFANERIFSTEINDYTSNKQFNIAARYNQDGKAKPNSHFGATINFGTSGFNKLFASNTNFNYLNNTYQSSISYSQTIPYSPFNYTISANHSQSTLTHLVNVSLPTVAFNMNTIYPFRRQGGIGGERWYEKIGFSYNMNAQNQVSNADSLFFTPATFRNIQTGMRHNIPVSAPFQILKFVTVTPAFNYSEVWALQTTRQTWNPDSNMIAYDTIQGFATARDFNFSVSTSTRVYGIVNFRKGKVKAIRHVMTPSLGFSFHPDFSDPQWNTFKTVQYNTEGSTQRYSLFSDAIYSGPGQGKSGSINFSLGNTLEMKVFSKKDTVAQTKKVKLLDALNFGASYNLAADSLNLSVISITGRTKLFDKFDINFGSRFDPYIADSLGRRLNQFEWDVNNRLARLTNANLSIGTSFQSKKSTQQVLTEEQQDYISRSLNEYVSFDVPWNLNLSYSLFLQTVNSETGNDSLTFNQTLNISGGLNLTEKWKLTASTSYDFVNHQFPTASLGIYRDLHCWEMSIQWVPFGIRPSYSFVLRVKASVLQDLKLPKRSDWNEF